MKQLITLLIAGLLGLSAHAQDAASGTVPEITGPKTVSATDVSPSDFLWLNRLIVVFADTDRDPAFRKQMELLEVRPNDLAERDVVVVVDINPADKTEFREQLRPRGFSLVLVDLDGRVKLRKPSPWSTRELVHSIDKTQLRRDEVREAR
jgi:hypothetical protein